MAEQIPYGDEVEIVEMERMVNDAWRAIVDNLIRSPDPSIFGDYPVRSFLSRIDSDIRSSSASSADAVTEETINAVTPPVLPLNTEIIGSEDSKKEIISLLKQSHTSQNVSCVAIVGLGGMGKTTLAQLVYNDVEVQNFFEKRMWVFVSHNFDVKTILNRVLESLTNTKIDNELSLESLQIKVHENLSDRKYLLVLDDIWNEGHEKWTQLLTHLMCGAQDSKVLVTTRSKIVAQTIGVSSPYVLNGLTDEESWRLLKIIFENDSRVVDQIPESIGKEIAEKCKGVPLAIKTLGGLLQTKLKKLNGFMSK